MARSLAHVALVMAPITTGCVSQTRFLDNKQAVAMQTVGPIPAGLPYQ
jgi:hypothetical protein